MKGIQLALVCAALCSFLLRIDANTCAATASLSAGSTSTDSQGRANTLYNLRVVNVGSCSLTGVALSITLPGGSAITQLTNLEVSISGGLSTSPSLSLHNFGGSIAPGSSFNGATFTLARNASLPTSITIAAHGDCGSACPSVMPPPSGVAGQKELSPDFVESLKTAGTQAKRIGLMTDQDFVFDFTTATVDVSLGEGGKTIAATPDNYPAIIGNNIAMTVGFIGPCGINLPHTHPRATQINFIVSGSFQAGFFMENGVRFIGHNLTAGMATIFPQGAIHFEQNMNCEPAMFVAAFNNEDPGVQTTGSSFFGLPVDIAAASLSIFK